MLNFAVSLLILKNMITTELIFFGCFIVFIVGILLLDMLVIDKEAHEVSMKEAGIWTAVWITLALVFSAFLWFYGDMVHGIDTYDQLVAVCTKYAPELLPKLNPNDLECGLALYREQMTISYITGYLIEKTLSVDNLFVMMMIFTSLGVRKKDYQHVLNWGILGAIVLRFIFIFLGSAIIARFEWVLLIFGLFLVYSGVKMFLERNKQETMDAANHPLVRFLSKFCRITPKFHGGKFFVRAKKTDDNQIVETPKSNGGKWFITPLFVTVLLIEFCDLVFAFDSIPAIFSVSLDPYVVFFSNIFAILGLRAMFFLLAGMADRFKYLKIGVCLLLVFIGVKLLVHEYIHIDAVLSLVFIVSVIAVSIACSLLIKDKKA